MSDKILVNPTVDTYTRESMRPVFSGLNIMHLPRTGVWFTYVLVNEPDLFVSRTMVSGTVVKPPHQKTHWYCFVHDGQWVSLGKPPWDDRVLSRIRRVIDEDVQRRKLGVCCREVVGLADELKYRDKSYLALEVLEGL